MEECKTSPWENGLLWLGAGISIAEILTGMLLAPLGFARGMAAIVLGHIIGGTLMYYAGLIGGRTGKSAMETVQISFGQKGSLLFAGLNVVQLIGWTAVMIASAAAAANVIFSMGLPFWSCIIGGLIALWVLMGLKTLGKVNILVMAALLVLTVVLSIIVFQGEAAVPTGDMSFGAAVELAVAMPLSWLPLISDYTRTAEKPRLSTGVSCGAYFLASSWMFVIGMGAAIFTGESDIAAIMVRAGLGMAGILVVLLSTVTTTFLDVYSAGVSSLRLWPGASEKIMALLACAIGVILAIFAAAEQFQDFLYLIGSVFAPMTAILLTDYFLLHDDHSEQVVNWTNLILWVAGFAFYRLFLAIETPLGSTFPVMLIVMAGSLLLHKVTQTCHA